MTIQEKDFVGFMRVITHWSDSALSVAIDWLTSECSTVFEEHVAELWNVSNERNSL